MTEYSGTIPVGATVTIAPANTGRRRMKYQNNSASLMMFSATTSQPASATVGLAVPGGQNQIYEWPIESSPPNAYAVNYPVPAGAVTAYSANGGQYYVEES